MIISYLSLIFSLLDLPDDEDMIPDQYDDSKYELGEEKGFTIEGKLSPNFL